MTILHRALLRETALTAGGAALVLLSIFVLARLVAVLRRAAEGDIPLGGVVQVLSLRLMTNVDIMVPLVFYVAVLMALGRWSRDNEITVLAAAGLGPAQFLKPLAALALFAAAVAGSFSLYLSPLAVRAVEAIEQGYERRAETALIDTGAFTEIRSGGVYFIERFDDETGRYRNVFFYGRERGRDFVVAADVGFVTVDADSGDPFLVLKDGSRYGVVAGEPGYEVIDFETYAIRLSHRRTDTLAVPLKGMETSELLAAGHRVRVVELNWRLSKIAVIPALALFALSFGMADNRAGRLSGMFLAFLVYFAYANLVGFAVAAMRRGELHPWLGVWYVHLAFLALALWTFWRRLVGPRARPSSRRDRWRSKEARGDP